MVVVDPCVAGSPTPAHGDREVPKGQQGPMITSSSEELSLKLSSGSIVDGVVGRPGASSGSGGLKNLLLTTYKPPSRVSQCSQFGDSLLMGLYEAGSAVVIA